MIVIVHADTYKSYKNLDVLESKHLGISPRHLFVNKHKPIKEIEYFWKQNAF